MDCPLFLCQNYMDHGLQMMMKRYAKLTNSDKNKIERGELKTD